jgi:hypothetical protein
MRIAGWAARCAESYDDGELIRMAEVQRVTVQRETRSQPSAKFSSCEHSF